MVMSYVRKASEREFYSTIFLHDRLQRRQHPIKMYQTRRGLRKKVAFLKIIIKTKIQWIKQKVENSLSKV